MDDGTGGFSNAVSFSFDTFVSPKLQNIAKALAPCNLRLGGTMADFLTFDPDADLTGPLPKSTRTYGHELWDRRSWRKFENLILPVLYKRLVEGPVFNVSVNPSTPELRVYAHCASKNSFGNGAVVFYFMNLGDQPLELALTSFEGKLLQLYLLTPGDADGLKSRFVKLNGMKLVMAGSELPVMSPRPHIGDVTVGPHSFGFIVVPDAGVKLCSDYFKSH